MARLESGVRTALDEDPDGTAVPQATDLLAMVGRARAARMACDFTALTDILPRLIAGARAVAADGRDPAGTGLSCFVAGATDAAFTIKAHGHVGLAARLADAAQDAASTLDNPIERAAATFAAAQCALAGGALRKSLRLADEDAARIGDVGEDASLTWYGMLHLHAALSEAALGHSDNVAPHLAEAESVAVRVSSDPWLQELTPTNVGIWRVAVALENGEPDKAPQYANRIDRTKIRGVDRRAHLHIDTGRGLYVSGQVEAAVREFLLADELAPQKLRSRPWVLELVGQMVRDAPRRGGRDELRELAARCHVDPLSEPE